MKNEEKTEKIPAKEVQRQSNFELLRIFAMLLIIAHHLGLSILRTTCEFPIVANLYITRALTIGGKLGVNIFVMISGYFLSVSTFKPRKFLALAGEVVFYGAGIFFAFGTAGVAKFTFENFLLSFDYGFVLYYLIIYITSPFINILVKNLTRNLHIALIVIMLIFQVVVTVEESLAICSTLSSYLTVYVIAAYFRFYNDKILNDKRVVIPLALGLLLFITAMYAFANVKLWAQSDLLCIACSAFIFLWFKNVKIKNNRIINAVSKTTFGVYLIHDNGLMRNFLWKTLLRCEFHLTLNVFAVFAVVAIAGVFAVCSAIEWVRSNYKSFYMPLLSE